MKIKSYPLLPKVILVLIFSSFSFFSFSQTKINDGTLGGATLPDNSAILELESNNKGLLLSRVTLSSTGTWGLAGATPVAGMMVYNISAGITSSNTAYPIIPGGIGCYYWNGTGWVAIKMDIFKAYADTTYWRVYGNSGTTGKLSFVGTADNHPLVFRTVNTLAGYLDSAGGSGTTSFGRAALSNNLTAAYTGRDNTGVGFGALQSTTTGNWNAAVGHQSLVSLTTGSQNTAVGQFALAWNQTGNWNTAIGQGALGFNTASNNTACGQSALADNTTGTNNVGLGATALANNTTGNNNAAVGQDALNTNTTGVNNSVLGLSALRSMNGSNNVGIGTSVMINATSGTNNVAVGSQALINNLTGTDNVVIGFNAASLLNAGGSNNIIIGSGANTTSTTASNTINIGNTIAATNINAATRKVGINNTAPNSTLQVTGSLALPIFSTTANVTLDDTHRTAVITGNHTITLPAAAGLTGRIYVVVNQTLAIQTISSYRNFSNTAVTTIAVNSSITIQSNGTDWVRIQ